jgi:acetolactate synthase-1/2/3 large subunit
MDSLSTATLTNADAYLQALKRRGIKYVFANPGTDFTPIIDALARAREIGADIPEFIGVPHENVAMAMANGYYETSGDMAAVMVHVTVGTANALCGLMNMSRENVPVFLAAGASPVTEAGHPASRSGTVHWGQDSYDQGGTIREYVKWDYELRAGQPVDAVVGRALDIAMSHPRGPVYLTLPREVLAGEATREIIATRRDSIGAAVAVPSPERIEQVADMVAEAANVVIVVGRAGMNDAGFKALSDLAEAHAIPVIEGYYLNLPTTHPMNLGPATKATLEWADLVIVLESLVPWIPTANAPRTDAKIVHIANDPAFSRIPFRGYEADLLVAGDPTAAMTMLNDALAVKLKGKGAALDRRRAYAAETRERTRQRHAKMIEDARKAHPISPIWMAHCLNEVKDRDAIVINELGLPQPMIKFEMARSSFGNGGAGGLGRGLGAALGAKLAAPHRQVIAAVGDGSYMFGIPMAAHYVGNARKLPTLTIISNNSEWHAVRRATLMASPEGPASRTNEMPLVSLAPSPKFEKAIEACDGIGERIDDPEKFRPALERALKHVDGGTQVVINVVTQSGRH